MKRARTMNGLASIAVVTFLLACSGGKSGPSASIHPTKPGEGRLGPAADPPPSRVTMHVSIFSDAIASELDQSVPATGMGDVDFVAGQKIHYTWKREPFQLRFDRGRLIVSTTATVLVRLLGERSFLIHLTVGGEPVITPDYQAELQSTDVDVKADGSVERVNRAIEERLKAELTAQLESFHLDVRPLVQELYARIAAPIPLPFGGGGRGDGHDHKGGCAELRVAAIEAGPTVLARGVEKDLGVVVLPSVTLPCSRTTTIAPPLPLLANVASIPSGPFTVVVPIAAEYGELSRAMEQAINGRLHFSTEYPHLYLEKPQVYASDETLVIRLNLGGVAEAPGGVTTNLEGELYFSGHPRLADNQITVPDLELTTGTVDALLRLKFALDGNGIRDQARAALRLDVSERLAMVKDKLSKELSFNEGLGCVRAELLRSEITGIYPHQGFLRIYVTVNAQVSIYLPCRH
jgi:uncharacterized protein DUF4403